MRPQVPPNLLAIVDATGPDQKIHVALKAAVGIEVIGNICARELFENLGAIRLETSIVSHPKWRRSRQRQNMRQKIARRIHNVNATIEVCDANVNVQAENQKRSGYVLEFLNEERISLVVINLLIFPV